MSATALRTDPDAALRVVATCPEDLLLLSDSLGLPSPATARDLAGRLADRFGSVAAVFSASPDALAAEPGVTDEVAARVGRVHALAVRLAASKLAGRDVIASWSALLAYVRSALRNQTREQFRVLFLDKKNGLIRDEVLGVGTVDHAPVYPREVMRRALELGAVHLILVHNHPAGDPTPSQTDIDMTREVVAAGRALKIAVHDHLIVAGDGVASFKALGLM